VPTIALRPSPAPKRRGKPDLSPKVRAQEPQGIVKAPHLLEIGPKAHVYLAQATLAKVHHDETKTPTTTSPSARLRQGISVKSPTTGCSRMHARASSITGIAIVELVKMKK